MGLATRSRRLERLTQDGSISTFRETLPTPGPCARAEAWRFRRQGRGIGQLPVQPGFPRGSRYHESARSAGFLPSLGRNPFLC